MIPLHIVSVYLNEDCIVFFPMVACRNQGSFVDVDPRIDRMPQRMTEKTKKLNKSPFHFSLLLLHITSLSSNSQ